MIKSNFKNLNRSCDNHHKFEHNYDALIYLDTIIILLYTYQKFENKRLKIIIYSRYIITFKFVEYNTIKDQ